MTRLILILDDDYERQYHESMDYLNSKYHNHPTHLTPMPDEDAPYNADYQPGQKRPRQERMRVR